jgi:sulfonate transport system substrate-binding protein
MMEVIMSRMLRVVIFAFLFFSLSCSSEKPTQADSPVIRLGWQTAWATQGQVMQAMINTNIPKLCNSKISFMDFLFGPDLNEAAITGNLDVTNAGIVPVINLLSASDDWIIVGRQVDFLLSIVGRKESGVKAIKDLKGKCFGVPIGGGSHPYALQLLKENGLSIGEGPGEVNVINVKPSEMPIAIKQGAVDAIATWEPTTTIAVDSGGEVINERRYVGFICINRNFAQNHPDAVIAMLKSYVLSYLFTSQHRQQTDSWFAKVSGLEKALIDRIKVIEPNLNAKSLKDVLIAVKEEDVAFAQQVADVMYEGKLLKRSVDLKKRIDMSYAEKALADLQQSEKIIERIIINEQ